MRNTLFALLFTLPLLAQDYRLDEVKRTVEVNDVRATKGQPAKGGDEVVTGWFSYALIASEGHRAKFEIFSATEVKLAEGTPGVILSVERGRIRAAFDKIMGSEPRVVKTPGALLAVRGTRFDVEVNAEGDTTVDVWEGIVEVQSPLRPEPMLVRAGEESRYGRNRPPETRPMPEHRRRQDPTRHPRPEEDGVRPRDPNGNPRGGHHQPPAQPQPRTGGHHPTTPPPTPQRPPE